MNGAAKPTKAEMIANSLALIVEYQRSPSVLLRNRVILSYENLIWKWIGQFIERKDRADAYQFCCLRLLQYVDRNPHYEDLDAYIRTLIPKSLLTFRRRNYESYENCTVLIADLGFFELRLVSSIRLGKSLEEEELWAIVKDTLNSSPQQLLLAQRIWREGWSFGDCERILGLTGKQISSALVKARNKVRDRLEGQDYEIPTKKGGASRDDLHKQIIQCRQQGMGLKALSLRFNYTRKGIWNVLRQHGL